VFANPYFDESAYVATSELQTGVDYGGYISSGYFYNTSVCLATNGGPDICTISN